MKYTEGFEKLGMPDDFKFGIELEAFNVKTKGPDSLYTGASAEYIKSKNWHMATKAEESLVAEGGAELVSPILHDSEQDWRSLSEICQHMKKYPGPKGNKVVADSKCGMHVHFDANCLNNYPNRMKNFLRLYAESEELIYKMCNAKGDPIRKGAINKDFKGLHLISALWRNGMAAPSSKKILRQIENGTLKVSYKKFGVLKMVAGKYKLDERRYAGLNLTNIGNPKKNTIEFRMANGSLDPESIKQTVFLYASLIDTAINITNQPDVYKDKLDSFYNVNVSEEEKAKNFLNLIMPNPEDRQIYFDRWSSVKDAPVFAKDSKKGFAQNRFQREDFKKIAMRTPPDRIHNTYRHLQNIISKIRESAIRANSNRKGDVSYDRG